MKNLILICIVIVICCSTVVCEDPVPTPTLGFTTELKASVGIEKGYLEVKNLDSFEWRECKISINSGFFDNGYYKKAGTFSSGTNKKISLLEFTNSNGNRFNILSLKPEKVTVRCYIQGDISAFYIGHFQE